MTCVVCGSSVNNVVVHLGSHPHPGLYLDRSPRPSASVVVHRCGHCSHLALADPLDGPPDVAATAGQTIEYQRHCIRLARDLMSLQNADRILDVGTDDGVMCMAFLQAGATLDGMVSITPDPNAPPHLPLTQIAGTIDEVAVPDGPYQVITCLDGLQRSKDPGAVIAKIESLLTADGLVVIQVPYAVDIIANRLVDAIHHGARHYWLLGPLQKLLVERGLEICDVDHVPFHGGSVVCTISRVGVHPHAKGLFPWGYWETTAGFHDERAFNGFEYDAHRRKFGLMQAMRDAGVHFWGGYGAGPRASSIAHQGIMDRIPFVVDDNPRRQGRYTSWGAPVVQPERLASVDGIVLFAWPQVEAIARRLALAGWHGKLVVPSPIPRVVEV